MSDVGLAVGLVLSGGGAKGAYQVGVLKALLRMNIQIEAISGASVGALNGAILACSPSMQEGVERMLKVWETLIHSPPIEGKQVPSYIEFLVAAGLPISLVSNILFPNSKPILCDSGILSSGPIKKLLDEYLDLNALGKGLPLYVSLFPSQGGSRDLARCLLAEIGLVDTPDSIFLHVQKLPIHQQKQALLASAAIPLLFDSIEVNNRIYSDGGQGGWQSSQGNTPISPLLENGFTRIIVTHLTDGSLWSRQHFPEATIYEIRPRKNIARESSAKDILAFKRRNIESWITQGYKDTTYCIGKILSSLKIRINLNDSKNILKKSMRIQKEEEDKMRIAMRQITGKEP